MGTYTTTFSDITGIQHAKDACVVIIRTEWNAATVDLLTEGCTATLKEHGVCFTVVNVPGAFEIPFAIKSYWDHHKYKDDKPQAFIALGCVIQGGTPHFEYISAGVTEGIAQLNILLPVPTIFGILTVNDQAQADERTGGKHGHKGIEAALTAIKMIILAKSYRNQPAS